eukprot:13057_6
MKCLLQINWTRCFRTFWMSLDCPQSARKWKPCPTIENGFCCARAKAANNRRTNRVRWVKYKIPQLAILVTKHPSIPRISKDLRLLCVPSPVGSLSLSLSAVPISSSTEVNRRNQAKPRRIGKLLRLCTVSDLCSTTKLATGYLAQTKQCPKYASLCEHSRRNCGRCLSDSCCNLFALGHRLHRHSPELLFGLARVAPIASCSLLEIRLRCYYFCHGIDQRDTKPNGRFGCSFEYKRARP